MADDKPLILIVDDTPANIQVLADALRGDYRVKVATNGPTALELACRDGGAGSRPARRHDARHGRLRGDPPA